MHLCIPFDVTWLQLFGFGGDRAERDPQRARCQHGAGGA
jgi:hypothetical protein